ncbi:discoidin domain-containing protein [Clostridioides difficile]
MRGLKKRKLINLFLAMMLTFTMLASNVSAYINTNAEKVSEKVNLALNKSAFASSEETSTFAASKVTDGIVDREGSKSSRWACQRYENAPWVAIDLGQKKNFDEVSITWERRNVKSYKIEISDDSESWTSIYVGGNTTEFVETVNVGNQEARYIRIVIDDYSATAENVTWETVSIYEVEVYGHDSTVNPDPDPAPGVNIALNKTASASSVETNNFTANKAFDGAVDRTTTKTSRWASAVSSEPQWLKVDLGKVTKFDSFVIEWERRNSNNYRVQVSDDDSTWTDIYIGDRYPEKFRETIELSEAVKARYVRLYIDEHIANSEGVNWNTVSVYELEVYNGGIPEAPKTVSEVANSLVVQELTNEDEVLTMPVVPEGFEISFFGADYEEVIDYDMNIHKPLVDTKVELNFEVKKGNEKATSPVIEVTVPGSNNIEGNTKPTVIPELREWAGKSGNFTITNSSRIVISEESEAELRETAEIFANDYKDITGKDIEVVVSNSPKSGDFYIVLNSNYPELREEGYFMNVDNFVTVEANTSQAIFLATRTILQILKQNEDFIPKGLVRDYPQYDIRGFMLDVGRKPISLDYLYEVVKTMSWYKMNDFQVHLNDNYIWLERDYSNIGEDAMNAYAAFRLESNDVGENGVSLTAQDLYYTKAEFGDFIDNSKVYGVNIVPEFDTPGHALAFVKAHPEYAYRDGKGENAAMLDVTNPEVIEYIKGIYDEYLDGGEDSVFRNATFHIGSDEFYGDSEEYRAYLDKMLRYVRDEKGRTTRVWGSLSHKSGSTPVTSENIEMNIWNCGWANPQAMYNQGYDLINTDDAYLYIVPGANYYMNYLNSQWLYNNWEVNKFSNGVVIPQGAKQMRGGMFALWNDMIDKSANGIVEYDLFDRTLPAIQVLSEKMWGEADDKTYDEFKSAANKVSLAPNTNPKYDVESKTEKVLEYDFNNINENSVEDKSGNEYNSVNLNNSVVKGGVLKLNGENSYIKTPVKNIGPDYSISFSINRSTDSDESEQILFESPQGSFKAVQSETGKVGFSREGYNYSFNYTLPKGEWVDITIIGKINKTELYVNGEYIDEISKSGSEGKFGTFVFPLETIGSESNSFKGQIDNLIIANVATIYDETLIPQSQMSITATSEHPNVGTEGLASFAIDGNEGTIWHTKYSPKDELPQSVTINLGETCMVDRFTYLPRQSGGVNGIITKYAIYTSIDGEEFLKVSEGLFENNIKLKTVKFNEPVEANYIKFEALQGVGGFASAAEFNVYRAKNNEQPEVNKDELQSLVDKISSLNKYEYIESTWNVLESKVNIAVGVLNNGIATQAEVDKAYNDLLVSYLGLRLKPDKSKLEDLINKVKKIDLSKYTKESVNKLNLALATASEVLANDEATQKEIDKAVSELEIAKANLVANSNESNNSNGSNNSNNNTNKPNSNGDKGNSNLTNSLPKTGAVVSSTIIIILAIVAVGAGVVMMKKKKTDK